jgi:hypothetical protein
VWLWLVMLAQDLIAWTQQLLLAQDLSLHAAAFNGMPDPDERHEAIDRASAL